MKWTKSESGIMVTRGEKNYYAYHKINGIWKLLIEPITIPPTEPITVVLRVKNITTAKQIIELLEK